MTCCRESEILYRTIWDRRPLTNEIAAEGFIGRRRVSKGCWVMPFESHTGTMSTKSDTMDCALDGDGD